MSSGRSVRLAIRRSVSCGSSCAGHRDKVGRLFLQQGKFASGLVRLPEDKPFMPELLIELLPFRNPRPLIRSTASARRWPTRDRATRLRTFDSRDRGLDLRRIEGGYLRPRARQRSRDDISTLRRQAKQRLRGGDLLRDGMKDKGRKRRNDLAALSEAVPASFATTFCQN